MNFFDYITSKAQAIYWNTVASTQSEPPYVGEELFPRKKQNGLRLDWIKGANQRAVELHLSAFDAKVLKRDRIGFQEMSTKMPFFKDSFDIDEELRQKLLMFNQSQMQYAQEVISRIFNDNMTLIKSAEVTAEKMRMQLITTGQIAIANNGQEYLYDYGLDSDQKQTVTKSWSDPTADIIGDIVKYQDMMVEKTGVKPTRLLMRTSAFRNMAKNDYIKNYLYVLAGGRVNATDSAIRDFFREQAGITSIALYDKTYVNTEGQIQFFLPEDLVIMLPEGTLGNTVYGTTPEEADLLGTKQADVSIVNTGVALTVTRETDPVRVTTKVSQICLPSGENLDKIVIVDIER